MHTYLIEQGYSQSRTDSCVYKKHSEGQPGDYKIVVIWVDDLLLATKHESTMTNEKDKLKQKFRMKDLGKISWFLGIEFAHEHEKITMCQSRYIERLLNRFGMQDCKPKYTPCDMNTNKLSNLDGEEIDAKLYREIVGALIYVMTSTRPDLCYIVTKLSQHMARPNSNHIILAKHVLRYLKGNSNQRLIFRKSLEPMNLNGFSDWANSADRRSITGYGFELLREGPLISWKAKKQPTFALSTCEVEYTSMAAATQEGKFLLALISDMTVGIPLNQFSLHCDNQGAIALANNPVQHQRSKHIDIRYHFVRDEIQNGSLQLFYIPSEDNMADVFTKPVVRSKIEKFRSLLMGT